MVPSSLKEGFVNLTNKNKSPPLSVDSLPESHLRNSTKSLDNICSKSVKFKLNGILYFLLGEIGGTFDGSSGQVVIVSSWATSEKVLRDQAIQPLQFTEEEDQDEGWQALTRITQAVRGRIGTKRPPGSQTRTLSPTGRWRQTQNFEVWLLIFRAHVTGYFCP